ncbi:MAG: hypothetical protein R2744_05175 [Bacteroidales bacterium]
MRIGLDVMGGDYAPDAVLEGAIDTLSHLLADEKLVLIGKESLILQKLKREGVDPSLFEIVDAPEVIGMGEHPARAYSNKINSSIAVGYKCSSRIKSGICQCRKYRGNARWRQLHRKCNSRCIQACTCHGTSVDHRNPFGTA